MSESPDIDLCRLLQWVDSSFPSGAFAHSNGLEAALQAGESSADELIPLLLRQQMRLTLPFMVAAWKGEVAFDAIEADLDAMLTNHVARSASIAQGRGLWSATCKSFGLPPRPATSHGHLSTVFGLLAKRLGFPLAGSAIAYGFTVARGLTAAAVRLGAIGPFDAQRQLAFLLDYVRASCRDVENLQLDDARQVAPLAEIWQATHDRLYSRLFLS